MWYRTYVIPYLWHTVPMSYRTFILTVLLSYRTFVTPYLGPYRSFAIPYVCLYRTFVLTAPLSVPYLYQTVPWSIPYLCAYRTFVGLLIPLKIYLQWNDGSIRKKKSDKWASWGTTLHWKKYFQIQIDCFIYKIIGLFIVKSYHMQRQSHFSCNKESK